MRCSRYTQPLRARSTQQAHRGKGPAPMLHARRVRLKRLRPRCISPAELHSSDHLACRTAVAAAALPRCAGRNDGPLWRAPLRWYRRRWGRGPLPLWTASREKDALQAHQAPAICRPSRPRDRAGLGLARGFALSWLVPPWDQILTRREAAWRVIAVRMMRNMPPRLALLRHASQAALGHTRARNSRPCLWGGAVALGWATPGALLSGRRCRSPECPRSKLRSQH